MSDDFESHLQQRMTASARALPYKADETKMVRARGRRRRIASQAATSLVAVLAIAGVVGVASLVPDGPDNTTQVLAEPDSNGTSGVVGIDEASDSNGGGTGGGETGGVAGQPEPEESEAPEDETQDAEATNQPDDVLTVEDSESGPTPEQGESGESSADQDSSESTQTGDTGQPDEPSESTGESGDSPDQPETTTPTVIPPRGTCLGAPRLGPVSVTDAGKEVVRVSTEPELQRAVASLASNTVILVAPGTYQLSAGLRISAANVTIRGDSDRCDEVVLAGNGMDNRAGGQTVGSGIWTDGSALKIQNLTIRDVYNNAVQASVGANAPQLYNLRLLDSGESFVIANTANPGGGASNGVVDYVTMAYTHGPPRTDHGSGTGATNGVSVLGGDRWVIKNSRFENFHTPDSADMLWNAAVLLSEGASNAVVESNVFVNVDRAIAAGGEDSPSSASVDSVIRNNMVYMRPGLYSSARKAEADAAIIVWDSPKTKVLHNTIITQGNTPKSIELRFDSDRVKVRNNLVDAPITDRSSNTFENIGNVDATDLSIFRNLGSGDLRLSRRVDGIVDAVPFDDDNVTVDIDGQPRGGLADVGADEFSR